MTNISNNQYTWAIQRPSSNRGGVITPKFITLHYTAGFSAESAMNAYKNRRVSAHLTLDTDATLYQHVPFNVAAWHAGASRHMGYSGLNQHSIGIEIVNAGWFRKSGNDFYREGIQRSARDMPPMVPFEHPRVGSGTFWWPTYPARQLAALDAIVSDIVSTYNILDIVSHEQIDTRGWKTDPGPAFPMERYRSILQKSSPRDTDADRFVVTATMLNVRGGPGTEFSVVNKIRRNRIVSVVDINGDWCRIDIEGNTDGWVHGGYLRPV